MNELISYVLSGRIRTKILHALIKTNRTPTLLAKNIKNHQSTTSRSLADLEHKGLVKCLTPKTKLSRIYTITDKGKKVIRKVNEIVSN